MRPDPALCCNQGVFSGFPTPHTPPPSGDYQPTRGWQSTLPEIKPHTGRETENRRRLCGPLFRFWKGQPMSRSRPQATEAEGGGLASRRGSCCSPSAGDGPPSRHRPPGSAASVVPNPRGCSEACQRQPVSCNGSNESPTAAMPKGSLGLLAGCEPRDRGVVSVDGTAIDYAVVQTPGGDPDYYLSYDISPLVEPPTDALTWTRWACDGVGGMSAVVFGQPTWAADSWRCSLTRALLGRRRSRARIRPSSCKLPTGPWSFPCRRWT